MGNQPRVSKGVPSGGQYTHKQQPEAAGVNLSLKVDWGQVPLQQLFQIDSRGHVTEVDSVYDPPHVYDTSDGAELYNTARPGEWEVVKTFDWQGQLPPAVEAFMRENPGAYALAPCDDSDRYALLSHTPWSAQMHPEFGTLSLKDMDEPGLILPHGGYFPGPIYSPAIPPQPVISIDPDGNLQGLTGGWQVVEVANMSAADGYEGPLMMADEDISHAMETFMRENPGVYAPVTVADYFDEDPYAHGSWVMTYLPKRAW